MKRLRETKAYKKLRESRAVARIKDAPFGVKVSTVLGLLGAGALLLYIVAQPPMPAGSSGSRQAAPELSLPDVNGKLRALSSFKGQVVLLDFWATWCEPCLEEIPDLARFHEAHKGSGFTIVGVAMDAEGVGIVGPFVRQYKIPYPVLISGGDLPSGYPVPGFPTAFLIDRDGMIVRRYVGGKSYEELERDVAALGAGH